MKTYIPQFIAALTCLLLLSFDVMAQNFIWHPASGTSGKNIMNWRPATCNATGSFFPDATDTLVFDGNCSNANCVLDTTIDVAKINVKSNYTGTISTSTGITLTSDISIFKGGTFTAGSITLNFTEQLEINGTAFTASSGTTNIIGDFIYKGSSFTHNSGTVVFKRASNTTTVINGTSNGATTLTLYKTEFAASTQNSQFNIRNITIEVTNELKLSGTYQLFLNSNTSSEVHVQGNIVSSNTSSVGGGTLLLVVNGTGSQSINDNQGETVSGKLPNVEINKASGTLSLYGAIGMGGSTTWEYVAGTISEGTARFLCYYNNTLYNNSGTTMKFNKLDFVGNGGTFTITGKIVVADTLSTSSTGDCVINGDTLEAQGNFIWRNNSGGLGGNVTVKFTGSNPQTVFGSVTIPLHRVIVSKTTGDITLQKEVTIANSIKFNTGYIVSSSTNLLTIKHGATVSSASSTSFVKGPVKKVGSASFIFPVGKGTNYNPIAIAAPSASTDAFTAEYHNQIRPYFSNKDSLTYLSDCEYWDLSRVTGSSNVQVTLNWNSNSCDIYTLSTLRIGRWDGSKWNNTGPVTTTGNTTAGTLQTNSSQTNFGYFIIAKRSPVVTADAGSNVTISVGGTVALGGSPTASGGLSPYTYQWVPGYALSSTTDANPDATPSRTVKYYLTTTDLDHTVCRDSVTVTVLELDLKTAKHFPVLAEGNITVGAPVAVTGKVGTKGTITGTITATDGILINTSPVDLALLQLDTVMDIIDGLTASSISSELGGNTYYTGVYRISGNATLNDTLILEGDENSYFVFDINDSMKISSGSKIKLNGVGRDQVFFNVTSSITITGTSTLNGQFLGRSNFTGTVVNGDVNILIYGLINGSFPYFQALLYPVLGAGRQIDNFFGYNAAIVLNETGLGDENSGNDFITKVPEAKPWILRYPGGSDARWWRWQSGWFRGYDNPLYNDDLVASQSTTVKYKDSYPLPEEAINGTPEELNQAKPVPNYLADLQEVCNSSLSIPMFDLNMETSDIGTEIAMLFEAHCLGIPVKYIELGNEMYTEGVTELLWTHGADPSEAGYNYTITANEWAAAIKNYFPDVKIGIDCSITKGSVSDRRNTWNIGVKDAIQYLYDNAIEIEFDALTFHVYPNFNLPNVDACEWKTVEILDKIMARPFEAFEDLEDYCPTQDCLGCGATVGETQGELSLLEIDLNDDEIPDFEGWITEFNSNEEHILADGTWAHALFVASQSLRALQNPNISKAIPYALYAGPGRGVWFDSKTSYTSSNSCETAEVIPTAWKLAATGYGTKYLAEAMKESRFAAQIQFPGAGDIISPNECEYPYLYGCMFSDAEDMGPYSATYAVILNLSAGFEYVSLVNSSPDCLFPLGGTWEQMTIAGYENASDAGKILTGATNEVTVTTPVSFTNGAITLKPYSITFIKSPYIQPGYISQPIVHPIDIQVSNNTGCVNKPITLYLNGAYKYHISPAINGQNVFMGDAVTFTPTSAGTTTYLIGGTDGQIIWNQQSVVIEVGNTLSFTVSTNATPPVCPGDEVTMEALNSGLLYNWYPADILDVSQGLVVTGTPIFTGEDDFIFTVNATDGVCYCTKLDVPLELIKPVDAGPDIYTCIEDLDEILLGGQDDGSTVEWSPSTLLDDDGIYNPTVEFTALTPTQQIKYTISRATCPSSDEVEVQLIHCCSSNEEGAVNLPINTTAYQLKDLIPGADHDENSLPTTLDDDLIVSSTDPIVFNGLFDVNLNLDLTGCTNLLFGPLSKIYIEPNCQLILDGCTLKSGCDDYMWQGIVLDGNIHVDAENDPSLGLKVTDGNIRDALTAISASKNSRFLINGGSYFTHNFQHLYIHDYSDAIKENITNSTFDCTGCISDMLDPKTAQRTDKAISLFNVPATGNLDPPFMKLYDVTIQDADYGIHAENTGLITDGNNMDMVATGIYCLNPVNTTSITANVITTEDLSNPDGAGISVVNGGGVVDLTIGGPGTSLGNTINSNSVYGIYLYGIQGGLIQENIIHIDYDSPGSTIVYGIRAEEIDNTDLSTLFWSNTIDAQTGGTAILSNKRGISLKNVLSGDIKCNSITNVDYGLQFIDNCKVGTPGAKFLVQQNKFQGQGFGIGYNMGYGLVLGDGISTTTIIDDLGNGGASCGNKFYDPFANTYALYTISTDASLIKYQKNSAESALYADNSGSNVPGFEILPNNMTGSFTDDCSPYEKIDTENEGNSLSYEFNIFPNPTFSDLQIFYDKIPPLNCKINISTITGKEILNSILDGNSGSIKIDFSQFPSGVYIVSAFHNKTLLWYSKLIKIK